MIRKTKQKYEARAHIVKAMAHPTRLFMFFIFGSATGHSLIGPKPVETTPPERQKEPV